MRSSTESAQADAPVGASRWGVVFSRWNRRLHYYLGLYLLLFVWLFALTGLLLNHSQWKFAEFWSLRRESKEVREIVAPRVEGDIPQATDLMRQLDVRGEIEWTVTRNTADKLDFRVSRPGQIVEIQTDFVQRRATVKRIELNAWGVARILHTFTGVRPNDDLNRRDWGLTSVWAWSMDAVSVGLILMVLSSLWLWWERSPKRRQGLLALGLGCLICGLFCVGLQWLY